MLGEPYDAVFCIDYACSIYHIAEFILAVSTLVTGTPPQVPGGTYSQYWIASIIYYLARMILYEMTINNDNYIVL